MKKRLVRSALCALVALFALLAAGGDARANSATWYPNGYQLDGQTNPIDYYTFQYQTYYRAASFSQIHDYGFWVGVYNEAGDWCSDGSGKFPKASAGWNWQYNQPNVQVSAMTDWVLAQDCTGGHSYLVRGTHNIHDPNSSIVDFYGNTESQ